MATETNTISVIRRLTLSRESLRDYGVLMTLVTLFVVLSVWSDAFLTKVNVTNILSQVAPIGILACGILCYLGWNAYKDVR